jgi:hypothetical protein
VVEPIRPFRWDVGGGAQLGSLLDDVPPPDLWFLDELVACAARVLARSADGDLYFVGRSLDSMYDLLTGALRGTSREDRARLLPLSLWGTWATRPSPAELAQLRTNFAAEGLDPRALGQRRHPVVFVDFVSSGGTFEGLFELLREWIDTERAQWDVIRRKLRFVGITRRKHTSPNTWRWQQQAEWTAQLPPSAIKNVSMDAAVWHYFGDTQPKATISFRPYLWLDESVREPRRDPERLSGLAQAVALVERGASAETRAELARHVAAEPAFREPWLRSLALELRG